MWSPKPPSGYKPEITSELLGDLNNDQKYYNPDGAVGLFANAIKTSIGVTDTATPAPAKVKVRLVIRSLVSAMTALANEAEGFRYFQEGVPGFGAPCHFGHLNASRRFSCGGTRAGVTASVDYKGGRYAIADPDSMPAAAGEIATSSAC